MSSDEPRNNTFRRLFRIDNNHADVERAVDDELQFHFELAMRDLMSKGATEVEARQQAEIRFGDVERTRRGLNAIDHARVRESRRSEWWSGVLQDLHYALRGLKRKPGFTIAVVLILALGIGANATMFGIVDRMLVRAPSMLAHDSRVQRLYLGQLQNGKQSYVGYTSYLRFRDLTDSLPGIEAAAAFSTPPIAVGISNPREMRVAFATSSYWKFFDMRPAVGRFFSAIEDVPANPANVAVLTYGYWQSAYGGREDVIGSQLRLGRFDYTIIGVAPAGFTGLASQTPIAIIPLSSGAQNAFPGNGTVHWHSQYSMNWLQVIVRREAGASVATTTAALTRRFQQSYATARALRPEIPAASSTKPHIVVAPILPGRGPNQGTEVKVALWLVGVALIVLVIACANVSNLFLARALKRRREIAVRLALGISRHRLFGQFLVESLLMAFLGSAAGIAVTEWGGRILRATLLPNLTESSTLTDVRTIGFTAVIAIIAGVCTGLAPALHSGTTSLTSALKSGTRDGTYQHARLRFTLLVLQGALSVVLLVGAGLFVRSLNQVHAIRLGYDSGEIVWVEPHLRTAVLDTVRERALYGEMMRAAESVPNAQRVAYGVSIPFVSEWEDNLYVAGIDSVNNLGAFEMQVVSPSYFETMGTRIVSGRGITDADRAGTSRAMIVSQSMANILWPGKSPLSKCVRVGADTMPCTYVVGVAEDIKSRKLGDATTWQYYLPYAQFRGGEGGVLFVRLRGESAAGVELLRSAVQRVMPGDSYVTVKPLSDVLDDERRSWRLGATMFTLFGVLALLVASVGLYSVIAYSVAQRTQEMGVRVALGAQKRDVLQLVMTDAIGAAVLAVVLGTGVSLAASRWVAPLLFETSPRDPLVYGVVATTLLVVAAAAGIVPALRASRVSPSIALRAD